MHPSRISRARPGRAVAVNLRSLSLGTSLVFALVLAGCASSPQQAAQAETDPQETARLLARFDSEPDPIGALLRHKEIRQPGLRVEPAAAPQGMAQIAQNYLGVKYRWGGNSPDEGFDCSGLVGFVVEKSLGLRLPRSAAEIAQLGSKVDRDALQPGDLVFFNTLGRRYSHVGIYVGKNSFVHAPSSGGVVRVENMEMRYWAKRYNGARRFEPGVVAAR